ncbi:hypothetical protein NG819_16030 [Pseudarthrobacter sp. Fe7]|nr:hypothetical protein NG819_16030 [Pseudarthrobacter sp. Fe7]
MVFSSIGLEARRRCGRFEEPEIRLLPTEATVNTSSLSMPAAKPLA